MDDRVATLCCPLKRIRISNVRVDNREFSARLLGTNTLNIAAKTRRKVIEDNRLHTIFQ
jgi:hypothetical protein